MGKIYSTFLSCWVSRLPLPHFFSHMLNKIVTSPKRVYVKWGNPPGLCSWGASLHPRLQVSLAASFHRQFPERMCCLDVWTQDTNMQTGKKTVLCISFHLESLMRETEEASLIQMSKWKPGDLSPVTAGLIPGSNQLRLFIHTGHALPIPTSLCLILAALLRWDHLSSTLCLSILQVPICFPCSSFNLFLLHYLPPGSCFSEIFVCLFS